MNEHGLRRLAAEMRLRSHGLNSEGWPLDTHGAQHSANTAKHAYAWCATELERLIAQGGKSND